MHLSDLGGGGGGGGNYHGGGSSCTTDECRRRGGIIAGSVIGGIVGLVLTVVGVIFCCKRCQGRPMRQNSSFVRSSKSNVSKYASSDSSIFQAGVWSSQYFQYGRCHGPHQFSLSFDPQSMKVTGSGSDDIGTFTIDGDYSTKTHRIGLTKQYQAGTGNRSENLGHRVIIQLIWNVQNSQFEGKWYVQTNKYHGEDKFQLKFKEGHINCNGENMMIK